MPRRTPLTLSTAALLCGLYALYGIFFSPLLTPPESTLQKQQAHVGGLPARPAENRRQAEQFLPEYPWAADAGYQIRTGNTGKSFVFAKKWTKIEKKPRVLLEPFAMIWRAENADLKDPPLTIVCDSALIEFANNFDLTELTTKNAQPGRIVGGSLEGNVAIRGTNGLVVNGTNFNFSEGALRVWSDNPVSFAYGPHTGKSEGLEMDLIPEPGPVGTDKPAISGIRTVRLLKNVVLDLVQEAKDNKPAEKVHVTSAGSFEYGLESHTAVFHKDVSVVRPTGADQTDRLERCETLTMIFEPTKKPGEEVAAAEPKPNDAKNSDSGGLGGDLQFRRMRAEGPETIVISQRSDLQARMQELTYDEQSRVVVLRDGKEVRLVNRNNELYCPEVTAVLDDDGQLERADCRGAGRIFRFIKGAAPSPDGRRPVDFSGKWSKQLHLGPDPDSQSDLDLIELEGHAVLSQPGRMALKAEIVRLWITPVRKQADGKSSAAMARNDNEDAQPKKLLALGNAAFASKQITGDTERLEVWFEEGPLPVPQEDLAGPPVKQQVLRLPRGGDLSAPPAIPVASRERFGSRNAPAVRVSQRRRGSTAFAAVGDAPPASTTKARKSAAAKPASRSREPSKPADPSPAANPPHIQARRIRVQSMMLPGEDPQIAQVITEGNVKVTQDRKEGETPFTLTGDFLHLKNYSETHQVIRVTGQPAEVRDRGLQLEGADIHFDRGQNDVRVDGAGVLRLPMTRGLDRKPLDKPQWLDIFWKEKMTFDGEIAKFYADVSTQLNGTVLKCEEMHVTMQRRISFADEVDHAEDTNVKYVICRDGVKVSSQEYDDQNRLVQIRKAEGFEFAFDQTTGDITATGPGSLLLWNRGAGNRAGLGATSGVKANKPLRTESSEWDYTRVDFSGVMKGNSETRTSEFRDRVRVVYGPVDSPTDRVEPGKLPPNGGWMKCDRLELTQYEATDDGKAYVVVVGHHNVDLEGVSPNGLFHAKAETVTFDESKGLYTLSGDGRRDATIWREEHAGSPKAGSTQAQRMEFLPANNKLKIDRASSGQGGF